MIKIERKNPIGNTLDKRKNEELKKLVQKEWLNSKSNSRLWSNDAAESFLYKSQYDNGKQIYGL